MSLLFIIFFVQILNGYDQFCMEDFQRRLVYVPYYGRQNCITYHELNCTNINSLFTTNIKYNDNYNCMKVVKNKIKKFRITTEIPENISSSYFENSFNKFKFTELYLTKLNIVNIIPGAFNKIGDNMSSLYLDNNNIQIIREGVFNSLTDLKILSLENNKIELVGEHAFSGLSNLVHLNLKNNLIKYLHQNLFYPLKNLYLLDISENLINTENYFNCKFSNISKYYIGHNKINRLNNAMFNNVLTLSSLDLSYNNISDIEHQTFLNLTNLIDLNISNNKLVKLSGSLHYLVSLTKLDLSHNHLHKISIGFFDHFNNLKSLNLTHNSIISVYGFTVLNVEYLGLAYNKIKDFNEKTLKSFPHLKTIALDENAWNCKILTGVVQELRSRLIVIERGHERNESNVFGIKCSESDNAIIESNDTNKDSNFVIERMSNVVQNQLVYVLNSSMARFYNNITIKLNEILANKTTPSISNISPANLVANNSKNLETTPFISILIFRISTSDGRSNVWVQPTKERSEQQVIFTANSIDLLLRVNTIFTGLSRTRQRSVVLVLGGVENGDYRSFMMLFCVLAAVENVFKNCI
ncbi:unnamed protein product [Brassicogethes aeneus]|uniref:Uncharacterized protein n=1 Tax=Brassicogethes aeneus TaxID=1431903 RepID=A0A9P0BMR6_BRAAE|nr:unnamed protein product [Brassicogethes aeneus]